MGLKTFLAKPLANIVSRRVRRFSEDALEYQQEVFEDLIDDAEDTAFGRNHHFKDIKTYEDFKKNVPIRDYEGLKKYVDWIIKGEKNVLWEGRPIYFAKTSGTTSGVKYIPITSDSIVHHIRAARNALFANINERQNATFVKGKMIFLSGSPELEEVGGIKTGRLSGISNHHVPQYLKRNQLPSYETNCIEDWELKLDRIVQETLNQDMTLISGIPPWMQMYFDRLHEVTGGKRIKEIFPNLEVIVHGGVNFKPYEQKMSESIGGSVNYIETYPASEGFIAYQNSQTEEGLLLNVRAGMFFEFVPADEIFNENPTRLSLAEVELDKNYALILSTNAGLWAYNIGDTVKFVSKDPYKIVVTGRVKHFISAFGEHVIAEEVEKALMKVAKEENVLVREFHVAPNIQPTEGLPHHQWFIDFDQLPDNLVNFERKVDAEMTQLNIYYKDLIEGKMLQTLKITPVPSGGFQKYMKSIGKLGGQNKVPRLANDRKIADFLSENL